MDFFYTMRIIDGVEAERTKAYFKKYYTFTENVYECLNGLKNDLIGKMSNGAN